LPNGVNWAVCFNGSGSHAGAEETAQDHPGSEPARKDIRQAIEQNRDWPEGDLSPKYQGPRGR
jgi:hypothetical protein